MTGVFGIGFGKKKATLPYEVTTTFTAKTGGVSVKQIQIIYCRDRIDVARHIREHYTYGIWGEDCIITIKKK